ncbi:MAG: bifunctional DNA-formamidopyrimidine glycosylase/DNA-(apurinic or apyrimidinic site) lyase [Candidatus Omnitrophota bacterium]
MPELPEVETIKRELEKAVLGKKITAVFVHNPYVIKQPEKSAFVKGLKNRVIKNILRKGKLLILELSSGKSLAIHLKMTGQLILRQKALSINPKQAKQAEGLIYPGEGKARRMSFQLSNGKILDFMDRRLLGELRLIEDWRELTFVQGLGPEPFDLSIAQFSRMLASRKTKIKPLLMDQTFISGIGNLYAAEVLFRAGIHPERLSASLSQKEKERLFQEINKTLHEAIKYKGSSVDQYVQLNGTLGHYVSHHKVYDRQGEPCSNCKTPIKRISLGGRGTYFCPRCQK